MIPDDAWPAGDRLLWDDDETFTHYDFTTEPYTETPYSDDERAEAEARLAPQVAVETRNDLRATLADLVGQPVSTERTAAIVEVLAQLALEA